MSFNSIENDQEDKFSYDSILDDRAFEAFFKKHYQPLCVYCKFKFDFNIAEAEDVVNTGFVKLWEARQSLGKDSSPKSYLYKIVNNTSLNIIKHEKVKQQYSEALLKITSESIDQGNFDSIDLKQLRADIDAAVAELPDQMRRIFELSRFEELKYAEIAGQLQISVKTVETQMSRALAKMRVRLSKYMTILLTVLLLTFLIKK